MTVRMPHNPDAGPWIVCQESSTPGRRGEGRARVYPWGPSPDEWWGQSWTSSPERTFRFDTKAEATAFMRERAPYPGGRRVIERFADARRR